MENLIRRRILFSLLFFWTLLPLFLRRSIAGDSIKAGQRIDDTQLIVSADQKFELGLFSQPKGSSFKYLGIWYKGFSDHVVWVANRDNPIVNSSATLNFTGDGNLALFNQTGAAFWSSNSTRTVKNPVAQLLNTGNLVLRDSGSEIPLWQSFDYPTDTLLPGMKLGWDSKTGLNRKLTSWRTPNDPSSGEFIYSVDMDGLPQVAIRKGNKTMYRGAPWFGPGFFLSRSKGSRDYTPILVYNASVEISFSYTGSKNDRSRIVLYPTGSVQHLTWSDVVKDWRKAYSLEGVGCDDYEVCGNFGVCNVGLPANCVCLYGYKHKTQNSSDGCVRKGPEICRAGDGFKNISDVKWPDSRGQFVKVKMGIENCEEECLKNCSCLAYGRVEIPNIGRGCVTWFNELIDIRYVGSPGTGDELFVRVSASELESIMIENRKSKSKLIVAVVVPTIIILALISWFIIRNMRRSRSAENEVTIIEVPIQEIELEMPITTIEVATNHFSLSNKIGEGGFGPVYKGKLPSGQEIAVKKLAESSNQGLHEFKNEVLLISQLQHRNLVKLLGFCIHDEETLLIYEYMPNKSLDYFLFDDKRSYLLDWPTRIDIIIGIARGLIYLHRDSRLRIIHRDLKVANILLDGEMKPKISDFGIARMFGEDQVGTKTKKVVGTFGYMSPEYAIDGYFSFKSDVFSFGVMVLEIVSGKKNKGFLHSEHHLNLLGHAWKLWTEERALQLVDATLKDEFQEYEALRYINIGLLCVQGRPEKRPTMSSVLSMLENDNFLLISPERPGFYGERFISNLNLSEGDHLSSSSNNISDTLLNGR